MPSRGPRRHRKTHSGMRPPELGDHFSSAPPPLQPRHLVPEGCAAKQAILKRAFTRGIQGATVVRPAHAPSSTWVRNALYSKGAGPHSGTQDAVDHSSSGKLPVVLTTILRHSTHQRAVPPPFRLCTAAACHCATCAGHSVTQTFLSSCSQQMLCIVGCTLFVSPARAPCPDP